MTILELHELLASVPLCERGGYLDGQYRIEGPNGETADCWPAFCTAAVLLGGAEPADIESLSDCMDFLTNFSCYMNIGSITVDHWKASAEAVVARLIQWGTGHELAAAERS